MMTKKNTNKAKGKNRSQKLSACAKGAKTDVLPPELHNAKVPGPADLSDVKSIREEMARIYRLVFEGKVLLQDATRLAYYLDRMIQAIKTEVELNTIQAAYAKAWGGVMIITDDEEVIDAEINE